MESLLIPLLIVLLFIPIALSGRKQRRQLKDMQQLQAALELGDIVVTTSGLRATVVDASYEETVDLEIADGVVTTWVRAAVREKVSPTSDDVSASTEGADRSETGVDVSAPALTQTGSPAPSGPPAPTGSPGATGAPGSSGSPDSVPDGTSDDARTNGTPGSRN